MEKQGIRTGELVRMPCHSNEAELSVIYLQAKGYFAKVRLGTVPMGLEIAVCFFV